VRLISGGLLANIRILARKSLPDYRNTFKVEIPEFPTRAAETKKRLTQGSVAAVVQGAILNGEKYTWFA